MPGRKFVSGEEYRFGFNGQEEEATSGGYDFGARIYNPMIGKFLTRDRYAENFPEYSPYLFAGNTPISGKDVHGDSLIIVVWTTGDGHYGHAALAVQNYKVVLKETTFLGQDVYYPISIPDGSYTYYDLWPGKDIDGDGVADEFGEAGPKDKNSGPIAFYQVKKSLSDGTPITLDVLLNRDPSEGEGYAADGVIRLNTDKATDEKVIRRLEVHMKRNKYYTSCGNNCSDLVTAGVGAAINLYKSVIEDNIDERIYTNTATTPNGLYKFIERKVVSREWKVAGKKVTGDELKNPGSKVNNKFKDEIVDPQLGK